MPDLEQRIKDGLDRLGGRPDPARVVGEVARRKRHLRVMHRVQTVALVVAVLAGVGGVGFMLTVLLGWCLLPGKPPPPTLEVPLTNFLDGVTLGDGCVVAAGAVLTAGVYDSYGIYGGIPARLIAKRDRE